ncbi:MAG: TrkH family potassium uptake protein [Bacteroidetes bacterium]|nr:TrkH family potassium uptake protein [Bacteroidota bacterium]MBU1719755.1 TrkH family potassium uptake protein [Bacteroidota bacterium]
MRTDLILKYLGYVFLLNAVFLLISAGVSLYNTEESALPLLFCGIICLVFGVFPMIFVDSREAATHIEGLVIVVSGWLLTCIIGMLPYLMWGGEFTVINAWFESVSGFTTTGSSILTDVEKLPAGILFWRSSTHWIGGVGVIIFVLFVLPRGRKTRHTLVHTEISDLAMTDFQYRAKKVIRILVGVYAGLTILEIVSLKLCGMSMFDAVNHSFATIATGGFSTKNLSIAHFNSLSVEVVIIIFMVVSGLHFGLIFGTIAGKRENLFRSPVVRAFLLVMIIGIVLASLKLYYNGDYGIADSFRYASFQVVSVATTTGFATVDTAAWPAFVQLLLIYFTIQCAMVGSTSGGLKFDRIFIFFKSAAKQLRMVRHPNAVFALKVGHKSISESLERQTMIFIVLYIVILFSTTIILSFMDVDVTTAFSASITTIGNVGPGFGEVSSMGNFSSIPDLGKLFLTLNMLLGRLEIFNIIALIFMRRDV